MIEAEAKLEARSELPRKVYRLTENKDPGDGEFWPEGRKGAREPKKLDPWERCLWECGTSVYEVLEDAEEVAPGLKKKFWVLLDLALANPGEIGIIKSGAKSHHDLIGKPGRLRSLKVGEGKVRQ